MSEQQRESGGVRREEVEALVKKVNRIEADLDGRWTQATAMAVALAQAAQALVSFMQDAPKPTV
jgi:hypothetical protein